MLIFIVVGPHSLTSDVFAALFHRGFPPLVAIESLLSGDGTSSSGVGRGAVLDVSEALPRSAPSAAAAAAHLVPVYLGRKAHDVEGVAVPLGSPVAGGGILVLGERRGGWGDCGARCGVFKGDLAPLDFLLSPAEGLLRLSQLFLPLLYLGLPLGQLLLGRLPISIELALLVRQLNLLDREPAK